jgi:hypothetical protein
MDAKAHALVDAAIGTVRDENVRPGQDPLEWQIAGEPRIDWDRIRDSLRWPSTSRDNNEEVRLVS